MVLVEVPRWRALVMPVGFACPRSVVAVVAGAVMGASVKAITIVTHGHLPGTRYAGFPQDYRTRRVWSQTREERRLVGRCG